jgi:hypothetical protein
MAKYKILCLFMLVQTYLVFGAPVKKSDIVFTSDFNSANGRAQWSKLNNAQWVKNGNTKNTCLLVNSEGSTVFANLNLTPYRGMELFCCCWVKADNVSKPPQPYMGVKYMLHYKSVTGDCWKQVNDVYGTFNWRKLYFRITIPNDVSVGEIYLELQQSSGRVWFDSISVIVLNTPPTPLKSLKSKITHSSTQFRGVMSPATFRDEDIKTLGMDWNANLIRWQLVNTLPKDKIYSLTKYDDWLNAKLNELDKVLIACKKYGVRVVIDLHSPPGGRDSTTETSMFYNKTFNDHFISIWKRIAQRYKGNTTVWGYDLVNEPVQEDLPSTEMNYRNTQIRAAEAIRQIDSITPIIFETEYYTSPQGFVFLSPIPLSNIIYEVHMYAPSSFVYQGVYSKTPSITYPGLIDGRYTDRNTLKEILQPVRDFQLMYHVPIYVGEFSAIRWAPGAAQYLDDCIHIFEEYGWNWTYHAFREWPGWSVEFEDGSATGIPQKAIKDTDRKKVLLKWFAKNKKH